MIAACTQLALAAQFRNEPHRILPRIRAILPLADIAALNRLIQTLCDAIEAATVPPAASPSPVDGAVVLPALTAEEFLFSTLLDGPQPAKAVERTAWEQHHWSPKVLWIARRALRVKAHRHGFGPGGHWTWQLPEGSTAQEVYFHPAEWRRWIAAWHGPLVGQRMSNLA